VFIAAAALFGVVSVEPLFGKEPTYTTLSAGWSWPANGAVADSYESGPMLAASFRTPVAPGMLAGFEVGYTWLSLDTGKLEGENPGTTFSGGDMGLLSITGENDTVLGSPGGTMRPFINTGLGFFRSYIDDTIATTDSTPSKYTTGVYKGSFFGFHAGIGVLIKRESFGLRLDASYHYLFQSGPDLGFFPVRVGVVFYP
jgi:hypothetical protein